MERTSNYKLNKPGLNDAADIEKINENADVIDRELAKMAEMEDVMALLGSKADKIDGKDLSTNDFTHELKNKLEKSGKYVLWELMSRKTFNKDETICSLVAPESGMYLLIYSMYFSKDDGIYFKSSGPCFSDFGSNVITLKKITYGLKGMDFMILRLQKNEKIKVCAKYDGVYIYKSKIYDTFERFDDYSKASLIRIGD